MDLYIYFHIKRCFSIWRKQEWSTDVLMSSTFSLWWRPLKIIEWHTIRHVRKTFPDLWNKGMIQIRRSRERRVRWKGLVGHLFQTWRWTRCSSQEVWILFFLVERHQQRLWALVMSGLTLSQGAGGGGVVLSKHFLPEYTTVDLYNVSTLLQCYILDWREAKGHKKPLAAWCGNSHSNCLFNYFSWMSYLRFTKWTPETEVQLSPVERR